MGDQGRFRNHRDEDDSEPEMKVNTLNTFKNNFCCSAFELNSIFYSYFKLKQCCDPNKSKKVLQLNSQKKKKTKTASV